MIVSTNVNGKKGNILICMGIMLASLSTDTHTHKQRYTYITVHILFKIFFTSHILTKERKAYLLFTKEAPQVGVRCFSFVDGAFLIVIHLDFFL